MPDAADNALVPATRPPYYTGRPVGFGGGVVVFG